MLYCVGRGWIEYLRIDDAHRYLGLRLNDWTSLLVFLAALVYYLRHPPRPEDRDPAEEDHPTEPVDRTLAT
jgi:prolipoprotein diacylglyceryltransferase